MELGKDLQLIEEEKNGWTILSPVRDGAIPRALSVSEDCKDEELREIQSEVCINGGKFEDLVDKDVGHKLEDTIDNDVGQKLEDLFNKGGDIDRDAQVHGAPDRCIKDGDVEVCRERDSHYDHWEELPRGHDNNGVISRGLLGEKAINDDPTDMGYDDCEDVDDSDEDVVYKGYMNKYNDDADADDVLGYYDEDDSSLLRFRKREFPWIRGQTIVSDPNGGVKQNLVQEHATPKQGILWRASLVATVGLFGWAVMTGLTGGGKNVRCLKLHPCSIKEGEPVLN